MGKTMHEFFGDFQSNLRRMLGGSPKAVEHKPRFAGRRDLGVPAVCYKGRRELDVRVLDISEKGMRLFLREPLEQEDTVFVRSSVDDKTVPPQQVNCRVVWCRGKMNDWEAGLEFNSSDENVYQAWLNTPSPNVPSSP